MMNKLMSTIVNPCLILNADAMQLKVGYDSNKKIQVKNIEKLNGPLKVKPDGVDDGLTSYFIK